MSTATATGSAPSTGTGCVSPCTFRHLGEGVRIAPVDDERERNRDRIAVERRPLPLHPGPSIDEDRAGHPRDDQIGRCPGRFDDEPGDNGPVDDRRTLESCPGGRVEASRVHRCVRTVSRMSVPSSPTRAAIGSGSWSVLYVKVSSASTGPRRRIVRHPEGHLDGHLTAAAQADRPLGGWLADEELDDQFDVVQQQRRLGLVASEHVDQSPIEQITPPGEDQFTGHASTRARPLTSRSVGPVPTGSACNVSGISEPHAVSATTTDVAISFAIARRAIPDISVTLPTPDPAYRSEALSRLRRATPRRRGSSALVSVRASMAARWVARQRLECLAERHAGRPLPPAGAAIRTRVQDACGRCRVAPSRWPCG